MQALYQPLDDSYFSAASELLEMRNEAIKEEAASDKALSIQKGLELGLITSRSPTYPTCHPKHIHTWHKSLLLYACQYSPTRSCQMNIPQRLRVKCLDSLLRLNGSPRRG